MSHSIVRRVGVRRLAGWGLGVVLFCGCAADESSRRAEVSPHHIHDWQAHTWIAPQPTNSVLHYYYPPPAGSDAAAATEPSSTASKGWFDRLFDQQWDWWPFNDEPAEPDLTHQPQVLAPDPF